MDYFGKGFAVFQLEDESGFQIRTRTPDEGIILTNEQLRELLQKAAVLLPRIEA
jgi:hypothetical protein